MIGILFSKGINEETTSNYCECYYCQSIGNYFRNSYFYLFSGKFKENDKVTFRLLGKLADICILKKARYDSVSSLERLCLIKIYSNGISDEDIMQLGLPPILIERLKNVRHGLKSRFPRHIMKIPMLLRHHIGRNIHIDYDYSNF